MLSNTNNYFFFKIMTLGALTAALVYYFHPGIGSFELKINGAPVADPLIRMATLPTLFFAALFISFFLLVAFLGTSLIIFIMAFILLMMGIILVAPYF